MKMKASQGVIFPGQAGESTEPALSWAGLRFRNWKRKTARPYNPALMPMPGMNGLNVSCGNRLKTGMMDVTNATSAPPASSSACPRCSRRLRQAASRITIIPAEQQRQTVKRVHQEPDARDAQAGIGDPEGAALVKADILFDPEAHAELWIQIKSWESAGMMKAPASERLGEPVLAPIIFQRKYQEDHRDGPGKKEAQVEPEMRLGLCAR